MKRVLTLLLVLVLALAMFVACGDQTGDGTGSTPPPAGDGGSTGDGGNTGDGGQQSQPDEDLQAAYDYIKLTYKHLSATTANFEVVKNAPIGDKIFAITWSVDNEAITITESEDGDFYVVNVPALGDTVVNYNLKFSVQNDKGEKKEGSFALNVPTLKINTYDEYVAAEEGELLIVEGIVTGVMSVKNGSSTGENSIFVQDKSGVGGYYAYSFDTDIGETVKVGMTVRVSGKKANYNGTYELKNPAVTILDSTIKTPVPEDFTEILANATSTEDPALVGRNGSLVKISGVTLLEYNEAKGYHHFKLGDHKTYLRISSSANCVTKAEGTAITELFNSKFYYGADVVGIITVYNGAFYLIPVSAEPFTNLLEQELPPDVKVDIVMDEIKVPGFVQVAGDTTLPTTFSNFSDLTIAWTLKDADTLTGITLDGATLTVVIPEQPKTITLVASFTVGDCTKTKEYTVTVKGIDTITIQEALNIGMNMAHNTYTEEKYYIVGTIDNVVSGNGEIYGNMYMVNETGDYTIYIYGLYDSTGKVRYDAMNPKPLAKDTIKVLSSVGKYQNDVQLKSAWLIEHTVHEDNKVEPEPPVEFKPVNALVGTKYYFGMNQKNAFHFVTGVMATGNASYYMATTNKLADAAVITVVEGPTADTYYITLTVDGVTKYMDLVVSGTHKNAVYTDTAPEAGFSFNTELKVFYKEFDGDNYTFGTSFEKGFTTVGGVKVDAEKNAMLQIGFAEEHTCTFTDVVTPPTCTEDGYTTHTCACGNVVVDTTVSALEHSFVNGECDREGCDATDHEHTYEDVVTSPTCTEGGYTTHTCTVPGCNKSYVDTPVDALNHIDENGDYKCDRTDCTGLVLPEEGTVLTVAEALKIGALFTNDSGAKYAPNKYCIVGRITELTSTKFGTCKITDATGTIDVYGLKDSTNTNRYEFMTVKPVVGDTVKIYGQLGAFYKGIQFDNSPVVEHTPHTTCEFSEATCKALATCAICGKTTGDYADHKYDSGVCSVCGHEEGAAEVVKNTVTAVIADVADANNWTNDTKYLSFAIDENITATATGGNNTGKYYTSGENWRIYQTETPTVTISAASGKTILSVKITYASQNTGTLTLDGVNIASNTSVDVNAESITFGVGNTGEATKGQARITSIEVVYQ